MHFLEWKLLYFDSHFTEIGSKRFNQQYSITGSDDALVPDGRQAIISASDGLVYWRIDASLARNELNIRRYDNKILTFCFKNSLCIRRSCQIITGYWTLSYCIGWCKMTQITGWRPWSLLWRFFIVVNKYPRQNVSPLNLSPKGYKLITWLMYHVIILFRVFSHI